MSSHKIKAASLSDQIYEHLRLAIICEKVRPGAKLVELDIATEMGTSQGPVREALQRLERDGLVKRLARSATFVTDVSIDEMYELFSIRSMIEGFAANRVATKITSEQCDYLDQIIEKMIAAGNQQQIVTLAESDMEFHRKLVEWSGSSNLLHSWIPLSSQIERFIVRSHPEYYPNYVEIGTRHSPIVTALRTNNGEEVARVLREHIMLIWSRIYPDRTP